LLTSKGYDCLPEWLSPPIRADQTNSPKKGHGLG
jgi:hypothetical protein